MQIAVVTHSIVKGDGQGRVAYEIARRALSQGHAVDLLSDRAGDELMRLGARWRPVHPRVQEPILFKIRDFALRANRALQAADSHYDIVQGFGYVLTRNHHVSGSQFVHDAWRKSPYHIARGRRDVWGIYQWLYTRLNARWEAQAYHKAQAVVACSHGVKAELISLGIAEQRIQVIWNAVDPTEFRPGAGNRAEIGLPEGVPLAIFVGDIRTGRKNLDTVLRALVHTPGVHLAVVGEVRDSPYPSLARTLRVADRVHFLGFRRDVAEVMRAADVYVFPSRYEPFGIVVLEALASGKPVITATTVGASEVVTPDCGIVLSDPNDTQAMACAIREIMDDPCRRASMGEAARAVAENHSWTQMASRYLALYEEIAHA